MVRRALGGQHALEAHHTSLCRRMTAPLQAQNQQLQSGNRELRARVGALEPLQAAAWCLPASLWRCRLCRRGGPPRAPEGRAAEPAERATCAPPYGMPMVCLWYAHCGGAWQRPRAGRRSPRVPHAPRPPTGSRPRSPACPRGSCSGGRPSAAPAPAGQTQSNPAGWRASDRLQSGTVARSSAPERKREGLEPYVAGSRAARTTRVAML